jgi:hypothetical protein
VSDFVTSPDGTSKKKKRILPQKKKQKKKRILFAEPRDGATRRVMVAREKKRKVTSHPCIIIHGLLASLFLSCIMAACMRARASVHQCRKWAAISFQTERMMVSQLLSLTSRVAYCVYYLLGLFSSYQKQKKIKIFGHIESFGTCNRALNINENKN